LKASAEAIAGTDVYADSQVGEMQEIVTAHASAFGGLWGDPATHVVTIYIPAKADYQTARAARDQILAIRPWISTNPVQNPWRVGFITEGPSLAELEVVQSKLTTAQPWVTDIGDHVVSWGIDATHHAVTVGVDVITPTVSHDALTQFGALVILQTSERGISL
jgi:hypothetical protein